MECIQNEKNSQTQTDSIIFLVITNRDFYGMRNTSEMHPQWENSTMKESAQKIGLPSCVCACVCARARVRAWTTLVESIN